MKEGTPAWSVVVVVFKGSQSVLAITRGFNPRDPSFPGGDSELTDKTPAETARREMREETGLKATEMRRIDEWVGERGQPVYAFLVTKWKRSGRLRSSEEGKPFWTRPQRLLVPSATYRHDARRLLSKLGRLAA